MKSRGLKRSKLSDRYSCLPAAFAPPSTSMWAPVMYVDSSPRRNAVMYAISSDRPKRPIGTDGGGISVRSPRIIGVSITPLCISLATVPHWRIKEKEDSRHDGIDSDLTLCDFHRRALHHAIGSMLTCSKHGTVLKPSLCVHAGYMNDASWFVQKAWL